MKISNNSWPHIGRWFMVAPTQRTNIAPEKEHFYHNGSFVRGRDVLGVDWFPWKIANYHLNAIHSISFSYDLFKARAFDVIYRCSVWFIHCVLKNLVIATVNNPIAFPIFFFSNQKCFLWRMITIDSHLICIRSNLFIFLASKCQSWCSCSRFISLQNTSLLFISIFYLFIIFVTEFRTCLTRMQ